MIAHVHRNPLFGPRASRARLLAGAALLLAGLVAGAAQPSGVEVRDPWIREAPPGAQVLAGYLELRNVGEAPQVLVGAASPAFAKAMLHQSREEGGVARMVHVERLELSPGASVSFAPGGYHLMLMKPRRALRAGDRVPVTLRFADGSRLEISFEVRRAQ